MGGALVNTSASGPMPTSRYCDQSPSVISTFFTSAACGDPGRRLRRLVPKISAIRSRMAAAREASPAARSSITRSIIDRAKVTPQALIACRSAGDRRRVVSPKASVEAAVKSSSLPIGSPATCVRWAAMSGSSSRSRIVGAALVVMSYSTSPRRCAKAGPIPCRQTRVTKVPVIWAMAASAVMAAG